MNNSNKIERPAIVKDEHLVYLDKLRESGKTNMFGAAPYLIRPGIGRKEASVILAYWMKSFEERHP